MSFNKYTNLYEGYIYKICNDVNNKIYIGQTITTIEHRWGQHKTTKSTQILYLAMDKYGRDKFHIEEIEKITAKTKEELRNLLNDKEIYYINFYKSSDNKYGYNMNSGGNYSNVHSNRIDVYNKITHELEYEFDSIKDAALFFNYDATAITDCCKGISVPKKIGYIFRYHNDDLFKYRTENIYQRSKRVYQFNIDTREIIGEYRSINYAATVLHISSENIRRSVISKSCTANGFYWNDKPIFDYEYNPLNNHLSSTTNRIPVTVYDLSGNYIGDYESGLVAVRSLNLHTNIGSIKDCCIGKVSYIEEYVFRFYGHSFDEFPVDIIKSKVNGKFIQKDLCKPVDVYDIFGNYLSSFDSIALASDFYKLNLESNISLCCLGKCSRVKSYVFRYHGDPFDKFPVKYDYRFITTGISKYTLDGSFVCSYDNPTDLIEKGGIKKTYISYVIKCCNGLCHSCFGYMWKWLDK